MEMEESPQMRYNPGCISQLALNIGFLLAVMLDNKQSVLSLPHL